MVRRCERGRDSPASINEATSLAGYHCSPHHPSVLERPRRVCEEGGFPWAGRGGTRGGWDRDGRGGDGIATVAAAVGSRRSRRRWDRDGRGGDGIATVAAAMGSRRSRRR